ncbi:MAG: prepilin peptidase [Pyrinomonadaceae bacterium]
MLAPQSTALVVMFIPLAVLITYMDIRYRRIPNKLVLIILIGGLALNTSFEGRHGLLSSLGGMALAFGIMFLLHAFGTMGAGDVKLFAAIGAMIGTSLVPKTFLIVAITGGALAVFKMVQARRTGTTMLGVVQFFYGLLPGQKVPRFDVPADSGFTLPYAVPICIGSLVSFFLFRA